MTIDKSLFNHTVLAIIASVLALVAWAKPSLNLGNPDEQGVVVVEGLPSTLSRIHWQEERFEVTIERSATDAAPVEASTAAWTVDVLALAAAGDSTTETAAKRFPGSERNDELFESLAPLRAARKLGPINAEQLMSFGLSKPSATLTLTQNTVEHVLELGGKTYGSGDRYVRLVSGAKDAVYIVKSRLLSALRSGASSLRDRRAVGLAPEKITRMTLKSPLQKRELIQRYGEDRERAFYADPAEPDVKLADASAWVDRLLKLRVADVGASDPQGSPELIVDCFAGKKHLSRFTLWAPRAGTSRATSTRFSSTMSIAGADAKAVLKELEAALSEGR